MHRMSVTKLLFVSLAVGALSMVGCRNHMPHTCTLAGGKIMQTHAKPMEGGYYKNWDPYAVKLEVTPMEDVNPVQTQHVVIATVLDKEGNALPNRRVEWVIGTGTVGDIVEVDESGWRGSRGYKVDSHYAVSHTNNKDHVLSRGTPDTSDDIHLKKGQTWCVITSPIEGDTHLMVYAPGIYNWQKHKKFAVKHWYDVAWEFPPPATNPTGTTHEFVTKVTKYSDGSPLMGYHVTYTLLDGPDGSFGGGKTVTVKTDAAGLAKVVLSQTQPMEGTNNVEIDIMRPGNDQCCIPPVHIATGTTAKTWIGPKISITKTAPAQEYVNNEFKYAIQVQNPSRVTAQQVVVNDTLPDGIQYVSSSPTAQVAGQALTWQLGDVAAGGKRMISVTVMGTKTGVFENCAQVTAAQGLSDSDCATTKITAAALTLEKQCTPQVLLCDPIEHTVIIRNTGDGVARDVRIVDELPDGLVTEDGRREVVFNAGTLQPGQAKKGRFTVRAERTGTFVNRAVATGENGLQAEASCTVVVTKPELQVTKTGPAMRFVGASGDWSIVVTNTGDGVARDVVLTDQIPANLTFVSADNGGQVSGNMVTWSLGSLNPGQSKTVMLKLRGVSLGTTENVAMAKAYCAEGEGKAMIEVKGIPAILLEVIDTDDPVSVGTRTTYVITVTNQGSAVGTNIQIVAQLPPQEAYVSSSGPTTATLDGATVTFAPLSALAPKAKATYNIVVTGESAGDVRFKIEMTSDQIGEPVNETEATNIYE